MKLNLKFKMVFLLACLLTQCVLVDAQSTWNQKAAFGGGARQAHVSFVIKGKAYVFGGVNGATTYSDLWEYDINTDKWTKKSSMPGGGRPEAFAFVIDSLAYVGTGLNGTNKHFSSVYSYNASTDKWTQVADFPDDRRAARAFAIDSVGYVIGGFSYGNTAGKNLYKYSPKTNSWNIEAALPTAAPARSYPTCIALGGKGYLMGGRNGSSFYNDFYEFDPAQKKFTKLTNFPGTERTTVSCFIIDDKIYYGLGVNSTTHFKDWYSYDPQNNTWSTAPTFPIDSSYGNGFFALNGKGFIVAGQKNAVCTDRVYALEPVLSINEPEKTPSSNSTLFWYSNSDQSKTIELKSDINEEILEFMVFDILGRRIESELDGSVKNRIAISSANHGLAYCIVRTKSNTYSITFLN